MKKIKCVVLGAADAGKTSLLRRYFYKTFQNVRSPTVGSDFYTQKVTVDVPISAGPNSTETSETVTILFQMWDTPGRVREDDDADMDALLDAFVDRVDGVMLVYDSSSSTSFTKLRLFHAHWLKKCSSTDDNPQRQIPPMLIVGNKRDLSYAQRNLVNVPDKIPETENSEQEHQRNVMGLNDFRGKDFRYEYRVYHDVHNTKNSDNSIGGSNNHLHHQHHHQPKLAAPNQRRHEISTFSSTAGSGSMWTQDFYQADGSGGTYYLDSLLSSEDRSNPDRDMVKLWCMRNGLEHVEVSALEDYESGNVDTAFDMLLKSVVLEQQQQQQHQQQQQQIDRGTTQGDTVEKGTAAVESQSTNDATTGNITAESVVRPNEALDLHERYGPKDDMCCFGLLPTIPTLYKRLITKKKRT